MTSGPPGSRWSTRCSRSFPCCSPWPRGSSSAASGATSESRIVPQDPARRDAEALDAVDPLAGFRAEFVRADDDTTIYLNGNSLGRLPRRTAERLADVVAREWGAGLSGSWDDW